MQKTSANGKNGKRFLGPAEAAAFQAKLAEIQPLLEKQAKLKNQLETMGPEGTGAEDGPIRRKLTSELEATEARIEEISGDVQRTGLLQVADKMLDQWLRPYLKMARDASGPAAHELAQIIGLLFGLTLDVSAELRPERKRNAEDTAWSRQTKLKAYVKAGFSRKEAFAMVLAEIKPPDYSALTQATGKLEAEAAKGTKAVEGLLKSKAKTKRKRAAKSAPAGNN